MVDYFSQLLAPISGTKTARSDNLLYSSRAMIDGFKKLTYWERLKILDMASIERRFERYRTIYSYKIYRGWTDNCGLTWKYNEKFGLLMNTLTVGKFSKQHRSQSFQYLGPRYFNNLPRHLRDSKDEFPVWKRKYNEFLRQIPDTPLT